MIWRTYQYFLLLEWFQKQTITDTLIHPQWQNMRKFFLTLKLRSFYFQNSKTSKYQIETFDNEVSSQFKLSVTNYV